MRIKLLFLLLTAVNQISGPNLGYVADAATSTIRVVNGIPGASAIGRVVSGDVKVRRAEISLKGDYALAVRDDDGEVVLIGDLSGAGFVLPIAGAVHGGDALALSPNGTSGVSHSLSDSRIQVIGGLPWNPAVQFEVDASSVGQHLTAIAVDDNAQVLAAFSNGESGALYLFTAGSAPRLISAVGLVSGIAFAAAGDRAVIADRGWNQVVLLESLSTLATPIELANSSHGISSPVGVVLSTDSQRAFVANAGSGSVTVMNLAGGEPRDVFCQCQPATMRLLRGDLIFALTERTDAPIVLFDAGAEEPQVRLVPAGSQ